MMNALRKILPIVVLAIAAGAIYFGVTLAETETVAAINEAEPAVVAQVVEEEVAIVEEDTLVIANGIVQPIETRSLMFARGGQVIELMVVEGDTVKAGDVIARLDTAEVVAQQDAASDASAVAQQQAETELALAEQGITLAEQDIELLEANLIVAREAQIAPQSQLTAAQAQLDAMIANGDGVWRSKVQDIAYEAELTAARAGISATISAVTQAENGVESAEIALQQAETRLAQAQLRVEQARITVERAATFATEQFDIAIAQADLIAPMDGTIIELNIHVGDSVAPSAPVLLLADMSQWTVVTSDLTQFNVVDIIPGMAATVNIDALPDSRIAGAVATIGQIASNSFGDVVYPVTIQLNDVVDVNLYWGLEATIEIDLR